MRIGMSCCGEGWGHVARMVAFAQLLRKKHDLFLFAPVEVHAFIKKHVPDLPLYTVPSLVLEKKNDKILWLPAIKLAIKNILQHPTENKRLKRLASMLELEAVISDYEPYLPHAARDLDIPILQINHPGIVVNYFNLSPDAIAANLVAPQMMGPFDDRIFISFYDGHCGPIIRKELLNYPIKKGKKLILSLKPSYREIVLNILNKLKIDNFDLYPDPNKNYAKDLAECAAVITSAGHQSISECIVLGKPIFVIPQRGQYEQRLNAQMLRLSGRGDYSTLANLEKELPHFLDELELYPKKPLTDQVLFRTEDGTENALNFIESFLSKSAIRYWRAYSQEPKNYPLAEGF